VTNINLEDMRAQVRRELEGGLAEILEIELPAVIAVQTGINEPRYASFRGIKEAMKREIKVIGLADLPMNEHDVGEAGSRIKVDELFIPPAEKVAQILKGSPDEIGSELAAILKEKGLI
jgi:electron transfer flavoprotein beta subunit